MARTTSSAPLFSSRWSTAFEWRGWKWPTWSSGAWRILSRDAKLCFRRALLSCCRSFRARSAALRAARFDGRGGVAGASPASAGAVAAEEDRDMARVVVVAGRLDDDGTRAHVAGKRGRGGGAHDATSGSRRSSSAAARATLGMPMPARCVVVLPPSEAIIASVFLMLLLLFIHSSVFEVVRCFSFAQTNSLILNFRCRKCFILAENG